MTENLTVEVGLHGGPAPSPFLLHTVIGRLANEVRQEPLWTVMFADDIVICRGELGARKKKIWRCRSMPWEEGIRVRVAGRWNTCLNVPTWPGYRQYRYKSRIFDVGFEVL